MGLLFAFLPAIRIATGFLSGSLARIRTKITPAKETALLRFIRDLSTEKTRKIPKIKPQNKIHYFFSRNQNQKSNY